MKKLEKAMELAEKYHTGQLRKSWEPYIIHPIAVMNILKKYNFPEDVLVAAILHDIVEDSHMTNIEINNLFWERVGFILYALSKNPKPKDNDKLKKTYNKESHDKYKTYKDYIDYRFFMYVNRFYVSIIADPWILFIKMADQIHNLSTLEFLPAKKQIRKIDEVENYFMPIYKKAESIMTKMYKDKYKGMLWDILNVIKTAKKRLKIN